VHTPVEGVATAGALFGASPNAHAADYIIPLACAVIVVPFS
jgi:hypothetical protein